MPAQSVAISVMTAAAPSARTAPADARTAGTTNTNGTTSAQFGQQLDAARSQQDQPPAQGGAKQPEAAGKQADGQAAAGTTASDTAAAAASTGAMDPPTDAIQADHGHDASGQGHDEHDDDDANGSGVPQLTAPSLLPLLGAALPGSMAHRGAFASSAGALLGEHGAAAVAAGIADAARMLQPANTDTSATGDQPAGAANASAALEPVLAALHGLTRDAAQDATATSAATGLASTQPAPLPAPAAATHALTVAAPLGSEGFHQELAGQVVWLAGQDVKQARIRVHPEDLGPLDLKVSMNHDHVDVVFSVQHPETVQTLQQSLPQLGQMLAQHGLSLGHAEVGQQGGNNASTPHHGQAGSTVDEPIEAHAAVTGIVAGTTNLLDAFA